MTSTSPLISREESQARLDRRAAMALPFRTSQTDTTAERVEASALAFGQRIALYYQEQRITYAELNARINQAAHALYGLGVRRGDVIALCIENRPAFIYAWLALSKIGAVVAFLNTNVTGRVLAHALQATGAQRVIVGEECLGQFRSAEVPADLVCWMWPEETDVAQPDRSASAALNLAALANAAERGNPPASWRTGLTAGEPAVYIFTSGTTGLPKAALISHARWLLTGDVMRETMSVTANDCFYCFLPLYHGAASLSACATALAAGASLAIRRKFSKREFWSDVRRYDVTICQYVGEICRYLLIDAPRPDDRQHSLRKMVGAGMSAEIWEKFIERFGAMQIFEGWGATEANANTINLDNRVGSCGRVPFWEKTNLRIVRFDIETETHLRNEDGWMQLCAPDEPGEAIGRIFNIPDSMAGRFEGYTSGEASEKKILRDVFEPGDAWWSSGDLLRYDSDGYCWFVDRIGDTYRWKSENVSTLEVADNLADLPGLEMITVYGVQVPGYEGRAGMAALVMQAGAVFDPAAFFALTSERLPKYAHPLFVRLTPEADMTGTYKLRKVDLKREAYDASIISDPLLVRDAAARTYVPLTDAALKRALAN